MSVPAASTARRSASSATVRLLLPREHGAYGQLLFPIIIALVLGNRTAAALALTAAAAVVLAMTLA